MVDEAKKDYVKVTESDLPQVHDSDLPHVTESDYGKLGKVHDSDLPQVSESDVRTVPESDETESYKVTPVSTELSEEPGFAIFDPEGSQVLLVVVDQRGSITVRVPSIPGKDDRIVSLASQCFDQMGETAIVETMRHGDTVIDSSNSGMLFKLRGYKDGDKYSNNMEITVDDHRLKQMPNPIRYLIPTVAEIRGIPEKGVADAFSKIQQVRRTLPGHI